MQLMTPTDWLYERELILDKIPFPKNFEFNLRQIFFMFGVTDHYHTLIEALLTAKVLFLPYAENSSTWDEQLTHFSEIFKNQSLVKNVEGCWPGWNSHPLNLDLFLMLVEDFDVKIQSEDNIRTLPLSKYMHSLRSGYFDEHRPNIDKENLHIQRFTFIAYKIFRATYRDIKFDLAQHRNDCNAISITYNTLFNYPNDEIDYTDNTIVSAALYASRAINNPEKYILNKIKADLANKDIHSIIKNIQMFIELCLGVTDYRPDELSGFFGRWIGSRPESINPHDLTQNDNAVDDDLIEKKVLEYSTSNHRSSKKSSTNRVNLQKEPYKIVAFHNPFKILLERSFDERISNDVLGTSNIDTIDVDSSLDEYEEKTSSDMEMDSCGKTVPCTITLTKKPNFFTARKYIKTQADPNYVPTAIIFPFLTYLFEKSSIQHSYAWLCMATGINWKRLQSLTIGNDLKILNDTNVLFNPENKCLIFKAIHGATDSPCTSSYPSRTADIMTLSIPISIARSIVESRSMSPFEGVGKQVQQQAKNYKRRLGGTSPTPERLNATFFHLVAHHGLTSLEQSIISGYFNYSNKAKSNYAAFDVHDSNIKLANCWSSFHEHLTEELELSIDANVFPTKLPPFTISGTVGSLLACPLHDFKPLVSAFLEHPLANDKRKLKLLDERVSEVQYRYAYLYLLLQLLLGLRPFGDDTKLFFLKNGAEWVIRQKDSANYKERSLVPIATIIQKQLSRCLESLRYITSHIKKCGFTVIYGPNIEEISPHPLMLRLDKTKKILCLSAMHGKDFSKYLAEISLTHLIPGTLKKNNIYRHSLYTYLLSHVSEAFISEFFQHHIGELGLFSKFSTVNFKEYKKLAHFIDDLAIELGFGEI